jgi:hypothetical protein
MARRLRRLVLLVALVGAVTTVLRRRTAANRPLVPPSPPVWPPIDLGSRHGPGRNADDATTGDDAIALGDATTVDDDPARAEGAATTWVLPVDGGCPAGYPIKANDRSHIFHVPGGRSYDRTVPERCYASTDDAVADGYRAAKA